MKIIEGYKLKVSDDSCQKDILQNKSGNFILGIGTKEGKILVWRYSSTSNAKLFNTKKGFAYGAVSAIDISPNGHDLLAGTSYGEVLHYELLEKINQWKWIEKI